MSDQNAADHNGLFDTALEQDSEVAEAQEGDRDPDAVAEDLDSVLEGEGELVSDDEADDGEGADIADPEVDSLVTDVLDVDSPEEADAAAAATSDEASEQDPENDPYEAFKKELRMKPGKWYVIHTYAGFERRVKVNLMQRTESMNMSDFIYQVEVPMEDVVEIKNGQRKMVTRVRIPGYVLVRMMLNEDSWSVVRHTPGVTGFVGNAHNPTPLRFNEAFEMLKSLVEIEPGTAAAAPTAEGGAPRTPVAEIDFEIGETITIKEGSFAGLTGTINEIKPESGKLTVLVSLFERETPVELSFDQVTKL
ncbi:transcription termination/antitermination protein NusG [Pseudoclavibacter endophyticus]|uniref:Transcription termination/antitermination protein NusG n=1 Tax=Pseudoclavibacter endophyticus TaxID=1778590 RepID=A0A6H9WK41_9MICO|nr:transcription termination/antitermination protein NusG [Pseudoclavibacter endophyticus]KAB1648099.1 transcription termination/antitermination protein NusG [Pseudoclavibacter endophyticus]GGA69728.1 transcription termination/antitermination protein NusG [Pseudoclavibacter endophyticus]